MLFKYVINNVYIQAFTLPDFILKQYLSKPKRNYLLYAFILSDSIEHL